MNPQPTSQHVVWICRWYPNREDPQLGVFIQKQAQALAQHMQVSVIYAMPVEREPYGLFVREEGSLLELIHYYPKTRSAPVRWISYAISVQRAVAEAIRLRGKPSLLLAYILNRTGIMARRIAKTHGVPFVVAEQWSGYASGAYERRGWIYHRITRHLCQQAVGILVVSDFLRQAMESKGLKGNYTVLPNIVETNGGFDRDGSEKKGNRIDILVVADLVDRIKNISDVIRSVRSLLELHPGVRLTIVGDGQDRQQLEQLSVQQDLPEGTIRFLGRLKNEEVYAQLRQSNFLVMNSRVETFSLICAEAMSCGKPVVATRCGGPESFVGPEDGLLIPPDDPEALLHALDRMCREFKDFDRNRIRAHAISRFSKDAVGSRLASLTEAWQQNS